MVQPHDDSPEQQHPEITLLSLSVQQLTHEARTLRETLQQERTKRESMVTMILLGVIAIAAVAMALHLIV